MSDEVVQTAGLPDIKVSIISTTRKDLLSNRAIPEFKANIRKSETLSLRNIDLRVVVELESGKSVTFTVPHPTDEDGYYFHDSEGLYAATDVRHFTVQIQHVEYTETKDMLGYKGAVTKQDCLPDLQKSMLLTGLAKRRSIAELVQYGCTQDIERSMKVLASSPVKGDPKLAVVVLAKPGTTFIVTGIVPKAEIRNQPVAVIVTYDAPAETH